MRENARLYLSEPCALLVSSQEGGTKVEVLPSQTAQAVVVGVSVYV